jgi:MFS family permease
MAMDRTTRVPSADKRTMRRNAGASLVGTTVEFYDFFIFGTASALVFRQSFFPELGTAAGSAASFATFGVAFVARPLGAVLFGHFGDKIGRKNTLVASLLLMGVATFLVGCLPTAASIGVLAPILLIALRVIQGIAVGGEWAGAVLLTGENAPPNKRGTYAMFPQLGPGIAFMLTCGTYLTTAKTMSSAQFAEWGWRIPFLASAVMVAIGLYVRLRLEETAEFKAADPRDAHRVPLFEVARKQPREIALAAGSITALFAFFHTGATYLTAYATRELHLVRTDVLTIGIVGGLSLSLGTIVGAVLADRVGRRAMVLGCSIVLVPFAFVLFPLIDSATNATFAVGMCLTLALVGLAYGPVGSHLPELFEARYRYTGAGLAYSLGGLVGGGMTPLLADRLSDRYGSNGITWYLFVLAVVALGCVYCLRETRDPTAGQRETIPAPAPAPVSA